MNNPITQASRFIISLAVICLAWVPAMRAAEPAYEGKALSEWLVALHPNLSDEEIDNATQQHIEPAKLLEQKEDHAKEAIRQMGTNSLPTLLDLVGVGEKNRRSVALRIKSRDIQQSLQDSNPNFREAVRGIAVDGFAILKTNAEPAIPQLTKLLHGEPDCQLEVTRALLRVGLKGFAILTNVVNDPNDAARNTVIWAIGEDRGGDPKMITQILVSVLKDPDWANRGNAARFLAGRDAELAVPALISLLDSNKKDYYTMKGVAQALGSYGPAAKTAVPKLFAIYTNNPDVFVMAALKSIDHEVAGQAEEFLVNSGPLNGARRGYTRTMLTNGLELIAGGVIDTEVYAITNHFLASAELLDPKTGKWEETGKMTTPREGHAAILLRDGRVLVVGGSDKHLHDLSSAELYNPTSGTWTNTGTMRFARDWLNLTLERDGKVLVEGGHQPNGHDTLGSELYDPTTGTWTVITKK